MLVSVVQPPSEEMAAAHGVRHAMVTSSSPIGKTLTEVAGLVDSGLIKPYVSAEFPLAEMQQAHALIEGWHTRGKIAIRVAD